MIVSLWSEHFYLLTYLLTSVFGGNITALQRHWKKESSDAVNISRNATWRRNKENPVIVTDYNKNIGSVDVQSYKVERKSNSIWYKKQFQHLLTLDTELRHPLQEAELDTHWIQSRHAG